VVSLQQVLALPSISVFALSLLCQQSLQLVSACLRSVGVKSASEHAVHVSVYNAYEFQACIVTCTLIGEMKPTAAADWQPASMCDPI
jgi:hypothetical protein